MSVKVYMNILLIHLYNKNNIKFIYKMTVKINIDLINKGI